MRVKIYDTETAAKPQRSARRVQCDAQDLVLRAREVCPTLRYFYIHLPGQLSYWELNKEESSKPCQLETHTVDHAMGGEIFW